jgi:hypothetical protein
VTVSWRNLLLGSILLLQGSCGKLNFDPQRQSPAEEFSPKSISGLSFWLRADQGVSQSLGDVVSWVETLGASITLNAAGAPQPVYIASDTEFAGNPVVRFAGRGVGGGGYHLVKNVAEIPALCGPQYSVVAIMRPDVTAGVPYSFLQIKDASSSARVVDAQAIYLSGFQPGIGVIFDLRYPFGVSPDIRSFSAHVTPYASKTTIQGIQYSGNANTRVFRDGLLLTNSSSTSSSPGAVSCSSLSLNVGLLTANTDVGGQVLKVAEIMIYDWALDDASFLALGCYAKKKYGISGYSAPCN